MIGSEKKSGPSAALIKDLLEALDKVFGMHPGFRPVHAKGVMCSGTFTPTAGAAQLTRASHAVRPLTPIIVRFSDSAGLPDVPDNDPAGASPRGMAVRFHLGDHVHTDIVSHSYNGFPVQNGEDFLGLFRALAGSGPGSTKPTPLDSFLSTHPKAVQYLTAPKPIPTSFARESFFGITALRFTNAAGTSRFGRFRIRPEAGNEYLSAEDAAKKSPNFLMDEIPARLAKESVKFRILVQMAAKEDETSDATVVWPESRELIEFGTVVLTKHVNAAEPEMRKIIFDPVPRVDGIDPSDDPLIEVRSAIYLLSGRRRRAAIA